MWLISKSFLLYSHNLTFSSKFGLFPQHFLLIFHIVTFPRNLNISYKKSFLQIIIFSKVDFFLRVFDLFSQMLTLSSKFLIAISKCNFFWELDFFLQICLISHRFLLYSHIWTFSSKYWLFPPNFCFF